MKNLINMLPQHLDNTITLLSLSPIEKLFFFFFVKTLWSFITEICHEINTVTPVFNVGASEASFCLIQVNTIPVTLL